MVYALIHSYNLQGRGEKKGNTGGARQTSSGLAVGGAGCHFNLCPGRDPAAREAMETHNG